MVGNPDNLASGRRGIPVRLLLWGAVVLFAAAAGCRKVALHEDPGSISHGSVHWFANEKTAFLFFAINETPDRLIDPVFEFSWSEQTAGGGVLTHDLSEVDFSSAVHQHSMIKCGPGTVCGSYSFRAENPIVSALFQFRYDRSSPLSLVKSLSPSNHPAGTTADAYSALVYGVFDQENAHNQVRVHHNFGSPSNAEVSSYGMTRNFSLSEPVLFAPDDDVIEEHRSTVQSPLMFPANFCTGVGAVSAVFDGKDYWQSTLLDPAVGVRGACFNVRYLDRNGASVLEADVPGYAFRNPEVKDSTLSFTSPLRPVNEIHVLVKICDDEPAAAGMIDEDFLKYQKFIMDMEASSEDVCFRIGQEAQFKQDFETHIANRLVAAKTANSTGGDYMFTVLLHEKFSSEFLIVQGIVADALTTIVKSEEQNVSPRLVGSFVYSGSTSFAPTANQRKYITWCPQELLGSIFDLSFGSQNCLTTPAANLDLKVINFVQPLGPFPSLQNYTDYLKKYGDAGLARSPDLAFYSPQLTANSLVEKKSNITFFDAERFSLIAGEYMKVCGDRKDQASRSFFVRVPDQPASVPSLPLYDMNASWLSDEAAGEYRVGIEWDFPFWGGVEYTAALTGKVISIVPFQQSQKAFESLGDSKWVTPVWNFGKYVQKCSKYCDNPVFDEASVYQPNNPWRAAIDDRCSIPVPPVYPEEKT